jgi:hypothetical protein
MKPTVLYIAGTSRSGSTLLDRVLGQGPDVCSLGELAFLWERGLERGELCGCGVPLTSCPFWSLVGEHAFAGWESLDLERVIALKRGVDRKRYVPALLAPRLFPRFGRRLRAYAEILGRLYAAVAEVSGATVLVDSSKHVSTALLLRHVPGIEPRVVQLIRDPRGVAWSMGKQVVRPDDVTGTSEMHRTGAVKTAIDWQITNVLLRLVRGRRVVRYEEFVARPEPCVSDLLGQVGLAPRASGFIGERRVVLGVAHSVSGNPLRFRIGEIEILPDGEWRERLAPSRRLAVSALTFPARLGFNSP